MLIIGAGGLVLQMLDDLAVQYNNNLVFWADIPVEKKQIQGKFAIISSDNEVKRHFISYGNDFILAVGNPEIRSSLTKKFKLLGGTLFTFISPKAIISKFSTLGRGTVILHGSIVEAGSVLGKGVLVNSNTTLTHETIIGDFSEIGPGVTIGGNVTIGKNSFIGAGAIIIPGLTIGNNTLIGAGAVVIKDIEESDIVAGVPAKSIKK